MRALEFITGHVIFKLRYNQIYQLKPTPSNIINSEQPKYENSTTEKVYMNVWEILEFHLQFVGHNLVWHYLFDILRIIYE